MEDSGGSAGILAEVFRQALRRPTDTDPAWTPEQWCEAFCFLFLAAPGCRHAVLEHQDDMLWFVTSKSALGPDSPTVTLRRNTTAALPPELHPGGSAFSTIDWASSVQLNLVVQARYQLTVVQCRQDRLSLVAQGHVGSGSQPPSAGVVVSQRSVYASPMAAQVNLDDAKAGQPPAPCYPDVCFAVDNFEDGFQDLVLSRPGDCYCVMLHVHAAASGPTGSASRPTASRSAGPPAASAASPHVDPHGGGPSPKSGLGSGSAAGSGSHHERRASLFSAYVTREQVAEYLAARAAAAPQPSLLQRFFGSGRARPGSGNPGSGSGGTRRERVVMNGPGGVGRAEVAAAALSAQEPAAGAGGAPGSGAAGVPPLQMSLMWMSLPAHALAHAVLRFACEGLT
ncbi:hypothetical protein HYH03_014425 [Edaphochlamys debaryana]|uniref:Uncharacterized protein n=1 Tax=Edaphochlamys debaryana TaxID=47281 RepID=A0A836BRZ1_9CHLO|nr:hypothetical protein HYH03_014425 [Edaphochlamys debaryana]|eukprot:KAG2486926.1 hypothetical protein HYH03_014425 [Edaphochlamys debaryana]